MHAKHTGVVRDGLTTQSLGHSEGERGVKTVWRCAYLRIHYLAAALQLYLANRQRCTCAFLRAPIMSRSAVPWRRSATRARFDKGRSSYRYICGSGIQFGQIEQQSPSGVPSGAIAV